MGRGKPYTRKNKVNPYQPDGLQAKESDPAN